MLVPFLDGEPGRHVGRVRGDGVRGPFYPVDGLGEPVGHGTAHGDALALDERGPRLLMLGVGRHESKHQLRGAHSDHAVLVGGELEEFSAETAGVEVGAGDAFAPLGQGLAVLDEVAGGVDGPLTGELVVPGVERVADGPVGDLRIGAVGRQRGAVEPVEEQAVEIDALAIHALPVHLDHDILGRVDRLQGVGNLVGVLAHVVDQLGGRVRDHVIVGDLDDGHRQRDLIRGAQKRLVDGRVLQRVVVLVAKRGVDLEIGWLGVALDGLSRRRNLGVNGFGEHVCHAVDGLDVEPVGHIPAVGLVGHGDMVLVEFEVFVVPVIDHAQPPHLVGMVRLLGVEIDPIVDALSEQRGLAVDRNGRVGLGVLLARLEVGRIVPYLVAWRDRVVQGQCPPVVNHGVSRGILGHDALEPDDDPGIRTRQPVRPHIVVGEHETHGMVRVVPLAAVLALGDELAGGQVGDLQGLLARLEVLVIRVGDRHLDDSVGETVGQVRLGFQTVFETLAGEDDLAVHAVLGAALGGFPDHILDHGRHVTADLRLVGFDRVGVDGLRAGVGQLRAVLAGGAERDLVVRFDAEVIAHLARPGPVGVVRAAGHEHRDLPGLRQALQFGQVGGLGRGGDHGAIDRDVPLVGDVTATVGDVAHAAGTIGARVRLVHSDVRRFIGVEQVIGGCPIIDQGERLRSLDQVRRHGAVDHGGHAVSVEEHLAVAAGLVGAVGVDHGLPLAISVEHDPAFVGIGTPGVELAFSRVGLGQLVPLAPRMVADVLVIGWQADGHIEAEHILVVERHHALVGRTDRADRVRCAVPTDLELVGDIAIVVGGVHEREAVHRVIDAVGFDHVPETQLVTAPAGPIRDGGAVGHSVGADAFLDAFDRIGRRHGADLPGLRRIPVRGVHGRLHASLFGHLDVDPICALGPGIHAEITRRGQVVDHGVAAVGEADRLAHAARRRVGAAIVVHDRGAVQGLLDRRAAVVRVDGVADRRGRADLHVGLLAVRGGDGQRIIDGRLVLGQHDHTERGIGIGVDGILHQAIHRTHAKPIGPRGAGRVRLALVLVGAAPFGGPLGLPTLTRVRTDIGTAEHAVAEARVADSDHPAFRVTLPGV